MASAPSHHENLTPKKSVLSRICRCCNKSCAPGKTVPLFGKKAGNENLIKKVCEFGGIQIRVGDMLPSIVCMSCYAMVTSLEHKATLFRQCCKTAEAEQLQSYGRFKRQRKEKVTPQKQKNIAEIVNITETSPSVKSPKNKRLTKSAISSTRRLIFPKPGPTNSTVSAGKRNLPTHLLSKKDQEILQQRQKAIGGPDCVNILENSGVRNPSFPRNTKDIRVLSETDINKLLDAIATTVQSEVAETIFNIEMLRTAVKELLLQEIDKQCKSLCVRSGTKSVLYMSRKDNKELENFSWFKILSEMRNRAPDVLDFISTIAAPVVKQDGQQVPPICVTFALMMHTRWRELSLCQKIVSVILGIGHATKKTFQRCSSIGISQSRQSFVNIMDDIGVGLKEKLRNLVKEGKRLRIVFDNFDFRVLANIILQNHRNSDMHWIAHYVTYDRFCTENLDDSKPLVRSLKKFDNANYLPDKKEMAQIKREYLVLVERVLVKFFHCMEPIKCVIPKHIKHKHSQEMSKKSEIVMLPVVPFNQNKLSDVSQYLEWLQKLLVEVYETESTTGNESTTDSRQDAKHTDDVLKDVKVPLGGDLLGRERITGARKTRLGCNLASERFESIIENVALWHCKQSFLEYTWEKLYQASPISGGQVGTLYYFRQLFQMVNVTKKVKKNYASCESLLLSTTNAYLCTAFMEWAGLETLEGSPTLIKIPDSTSSTEDRKRFVDQVLMKFVEEYILTEFDSEKKWRMKEKEKAVARGQETQSAEYAVDEEPGASEQLSTTEKDKIKSGDVVALIDEKMCVAAVGNATNVRFNIQNKSTQAYEEHIGVIIGHVELPGVTQNIKVNTCQVWPATRLEKVNFQGTCPQPNATPSDQTDQVQEDQPIPSPQSDLAVSDLEDRVMNYGLQVLQLGVLLMQLNDTEKEGDGERALRNWKLLLLHFRSRSHAKKYAYEAMRLISYTRALYTEKMATRILHGQFVNIKGGAGNNVANDLKMEHLIKFNKVVLHDLCGNKTLKAIQRGTKATYGLQSVINAFDNQCKIAPDSTKHTQKTKLEDEALMIKKLKNIQPFKHQPGRQSNAFPTISKCTLDKVNVVLLDQWLKKHKSRLDENACAEYDSDNEELEEDESEDEMYEYELTEENEM